MISLLPCQDDLAFPVGPAPQPAGVLHGLRTWWRGRLARLRARGGLPESSRHLRADIGLSAALSPPDASESRLWTL